MVYNTAGMAVEPQQSILIDSTGTPIGPANPGSIAPIGYAAIRIGSPSSYQTLIIGSAGSAPRVLIPVGG